MFGSSVRPVPETTFATPFLHNRCNAINHRNASTPVDLRTSKGILVIGPMRLLGLTGVPAGVTAGAEVPLPVGGLVLRHVL
jgi:hypothetical protein